MDSLLLYNKKIFLWSWCLIKLAVGRDFCPLLQIRSCIEALCNSDRNYSIQYNLELLIFLWALEIIQMVIWIQEIASNNNSRKWTLSLNFNIYDFCKSETVNFEYLEAARKVCFDSLEWWIIHFSTKSDVSRLSTTFVWKETSIVKDEMITFMWELTENWAPFDICDVCVVWRENRRKLGEASSCRKADA